jgi:ABC-type polysaccharide/polyol phosphate export permease
MKNFTIVAFLKKLYESRYMIRMMVLRDLKAAYIGSFFGFLWAILNPLAQLVVYGIVFGVFFKSKPDPAYGTDNFFLFLLCGLIPWQFFAQAVSASTSVLITNTNLIKKAVGFDAEILPIITVISNIISHFIGVLLLLIIVLVFMGRISPITSVIIIYLFFIAVFSIGVGWILSSINVYLRDVQQVTNVLMMGWMFLTPVFYSPAVIPVKILPFIKLNPLYHMVEGYRYAILGGKILPSMDIASMAFVSLLTFGFGGMLFRKLKPGFAEVL